MIITGQKERVGAWVGSMIGNNTEWHDYEAIGIERAGELVAGVVVDSYIKAARCSVHCAGIGRRWLNREFIHVVADYVFRQLECNAVVNMVDSTNTDSIRFSEHLGCKEVYRIKGGGQHGSDGIVFELQKSECKWINKAEK